MQEAINETLKARRKKIFMAVIFHVTRKSRKIKTYRKNCLYNKHFSTA